MYSRFFFATILSGRKHAKDALAPGAGNLNVPGGPTTVVLNTVGGELGVTTPVVRKERKVAFTILGGSDPIPAITEDAGSGSALVLAVYTVKLAPLFV